ncbi:PREDICTED: serine carboxypeptidase-like 50 [Nelumbo nucifera]|uniref:Carboxypeptidase n=1 Tax=Nelumbo nucifera TaxID=4432 RepID=A0A1U8BL78_NELNU|nr:PREDICTED: serine carboxypeptidase-like 50 [Nelumbo nucifera]
MVGNLYEVGPWIVDFEHPSDEDFMQFNPSLKPNPGAWNRKFGLLFLDNPIGSGYSIAATPEEIPRDIDTVVNHLFVALNAFMSLNQLFKSRPIYITGESYAGKYIPAIGCYILQQNSLVSTSHKLNLKGIAIGNGWIDPINQLTSIPNNVYFSSLINEKQKIELEALQVEAITLAGEGKWRQATQAIKDFMHKLQQMTGLATLFDLRRKDRYLNEWVGEFLAEEDVMMAFGAKSLIQKTCSRDVSEALIEDYMQCARYMIEELLNKTKVLLYQGEFDLKAGVVANKAWINQMSWDGVEKFLMARRKIWNVNGSLAGYVQQWASLTHVVVLDSGHMVPTDQPVSAQEMIEDWILERGIFVD